jgi:hypothetical protein
MGSLDQVILAKVREVQAPGWVYLVDSQGRVESSMWAKTPRDLAENWLLTALALKEATFDSKLTKVQLETIQKELLALRLKVVDVRDPVWRAKIAHIDLAFALKEMRDYMEENGLYSDSMDPIAFEDEGGPLEDMPRLDLCKEPFSPLPSLNFTINFAERGAANMRVSLVLECVDSTPPGRKRKVDDEEVTIHTISFRMHMEEDTPRLSLCSRARKD